MNKNKLNTSVPTIVKAGILAGTLDIICALVQFYLQTGKNPEAVLKYIASGVFGPSTLKGDILIELYGLMFHYFIAFIWTILFFLVYPKISLLSRNRFISGCGYGLFVWIIMTRVVVPLSNTPKIPFNFGRAVIAILILMFAIGQPISYLVNRYYSTRQ